MYPNGKHSVGKQRTSLKLLDFGLKGRSAGLMPSSTVCLFQPRGSIQNSSVHLVCDVVMRVVSRRFIFIFAPLLPTPHPEAGARGKREQKKPRY